MAIQTPDKAKNQSEPKEILEVAPTLLKSPEEVAAELEKIEEGVKSADANLEAAIAKVQKLESEDASTPAEMAKLAEISNARVKSVNRVEDALNWAKKTFLGKKEEPMPTRESSEGKELQTAAVNMIEQYFDRMLAENRTLKQDQATADETYDILKTASNQIDTAFNRDPRGTLANVLEAVGAAEPDKMAEQLWSMGVSGGLLTIFERRLGGMAKFMGETQHDGGAIAVESKAVGDLPKSDLVRSLENFGISVSAKPAPSKEIIDIRPGIDEELAKVESESKNETIRAIDKWIAPKKATPEETDVVVARLYAKFNGARDAYGDNGSSPEAIKNYVSAILELIGRDPATAKKEAETIYAANQAGSVMQHAEDRFDTVFELNAKLYPHVEMLRSRRQEKFLDQYQDYLDAKKEKERAAEIPETPADMSGATIRPGQANIGKKRPRAKIDNPPDQMTA